MRKLKGSIFICTAFIMACTMISGCSRKETDDDKGKIKVVTSFYPMYDFTQKVGGEKIEIKNMVPAGTEPHDWEPSASDIINIEKADVFIYSGAGMEHWVDDVLSGIENKKLLVTEASNGAELISADAGIDPHVWLNPRNAKYEMEQIKTALQEADAANADYYEENYEKYAAKFDELDEKYKNAANSFSKKEVVTSHEAFGYLCDAYGLTQVGIEGLTPDSEPSPARMTEVIQFVKEHQVSVIFFEEMVSPKVAKTIAEAAGCTTDVLNPLEGISEEDMMAGEDYFSVMEKNLEALKKALE